MNNETITYYNIPILFVFFNRKEISLQAFEHIRKVHPSKLYLAQDGPRKERSEQDQRIIADVRSCILNLIDWECDVQTLFRTENLGCAQGVKTAIDWLFENEEYGIILEDDCIPSDSFFPFIQDLLKLYCHDQRVGMIAGSNLVKGFKPQFSYHFSRFKSCWGWATWRRAWKNMDMNMSWRESHLEDVFNNSGFNGEFNSKWKFQLQCIDKDYVSAWDWQWYFTLASQNQLCIYPAVNLISNIGNDVEATHTSLGKITVASHDLDFPLRGPGIVAPDYQFDRLFSREENSLYFIAIRYIPYGIKRRIKSLINRFRK